jgi:hypothetical protein
MDAIPEATQVLRDKWFEGTAPVSFLFESQQCKLAWTFMAHHHVDIRISYIYNN